MERRRIRQSIEHSRSAAQRAIGCVTSAVVGVQRLPQPGYFMLLLNNRTPAPIGRSLLLDAYFVIDVDAHVSDQERNFASPVVGYGYTVLQTPATEVVAYHWHSQSPEESADPHVHFGPASACPDSAVRPGELHKVHFPTGFVSLEKFIWLVIDEFKVEPRRPDWQAILGQRS